MFKLLHSLSIAALLTLASPISAQVLPKAPDTGTPTGTPTPGTSRPEATCPETSKKLTAIAANNGKDFTLSAYPTFWFYIPYRSEQLNRVEFLLLDGKERETIYQATIQLTGEPGLIKISIPNETKYALQPNQTYRWRLNLDCQPDRTIEPDLSIDGWVRRIDLTPTLAAQIKTATHLNQLYQEHQIWYDAIDESAKRYFTQSPDTTAKQSWTQLLQALALTHLQTERFTSSKADIAPSR